MQERFPSVQRLDPVTKFPDDDVIFIGTCTVSVYNIARLAETVQYFTSLGLIFHTSQVQFPSYLSTRVLPGEIKRQITADLELFLSDLDNRLARCWQGSSLWQSADARETQKFRIERFVRNSLSYMNAQDFGHEFAKFHEYDVEFSKASGSPSAFEVFPEWKTYV